MQPEQRATRRFAIRGWDVVRIVLGVLLLVAAGLKLAGRNVSAVPTIGWFGQPWVQLLAAEWEIVLGLWLLSAWVPAGSWLATVLTFVTFAGVSGYLGWLGVSNCACFGAIRASPWLAFGVDISSVVLVTVFRPDLQAAWDQATQQRRWNRRPVGAICLGAIGLLVVVTAAGIQRSGSAAAALAWLRGEPITVEPSYLDFGEGEVGQVLTADLVVRNWTDRPVRLIGGTSDCSCIAIAALPITIAPGESRAVSIQLRVKARGPGVVTRLAELRTDCDRRQSVDFLAACRVR